MTLVELLVVMAVISILIGLVSSAFTRFAAASHVSHAVQQVADQLNLARQIAISRNEYIQVRFFSPTSGSDIRAGEFTAIAVYSSDSPFYGTDAEYQQWEAERQFRQVSSIRQLPDSIVVLNSTTYSPLLDWLSAQSRKGSCRVRGTDYDWVGFYFKPDGSVDVPLAEGAAVITLCKHVEYLAASNVLPSNYASISLNPISGRAHLLRP